MTRAATFGVAVALTILATTSHARRPSATVTGRVVDADLGTPIVGVNVGSRETGWYLTDRDGRFDIPDVRDGRYAVWIEDRYLTSSWAAPIQVRVENGRAPAPIEFRVRLEGSLSGRVTDERGEPVVNARVQVVNRVFDITGGTGEMQSHTGERAYAASELTVVARRQATSDSRGYYTIEGVPAGVRHRVLAVMPRRYPAPISDAPSDPAARPTNLMAAYHPAAASFDAATDVVVHSNERKSGVDIRMRRAPSFCLEATLAPQESSGPAWFILEEDEASRILRIGSGLVRASGFTDANGRLRVCDLYAGRFFFTAADRVMPIAITGAEDIPYAIVLVWPADAKTDAALAAELVAGISNESGGFLYGALRPGRYHLLATHVPPPYRLQVGPLVPNLWKTPETIALLRRSGPLAQEVVVTPRTISAVELTPTTFPADVNRPPSK